MVPVSSAKSSFLQTRLRLRVFAFQDKVRRALRVQKMLAHMVSSATSSRLQERPLHRLGLRVLAKALQRCWACNLLDGGAQVVGHLVSRHCFLWASVVRCSP